MRSFVLGCGAALLLTLPSVGCASASTTDRSASVANSYPSGCQKISFTGDGGYFDQGNFYTQPEYTVTITTKWCYSNNAITSHEAKYTTDIPSSQDPQISFADVLNSAGTVLHLSAGGTYNSGVINNVGLIEIVGHVTSIGGHHFRNIPSAGG